MRTNELTTYTRGDLTISSPDEGVVLKLETLAIAAAPAIAASGIPAIGQYWPGEGGINMGLVAARGDVPAHYLIAASQDIGDHAWGGYRAELKGTSKTDGLLNTRLLCDDEVQHPAANACAEYQADGHHDFYLPAASELYQGWLNCPEVFAQDCYYWSSSQRSANYAFNMTFDVGYRHFYGKTNELRVRPVRRVLIEA